jgi:hypothetical protein
MHTHPAGMFGPVQTGSPPVSGAVLASFAPLLPPLLLAPLLPAPLLAPLLPAPLLPPLLLAPLLLAPLLPAPLLLLLAPLLLLLLPSAPALPSGRGLFAGDSPPQSIRASDRTVAKGTSRMTQ